MSLKITVETIEHFRKTATDLKVLEGSSEVHATMKSINRTHHFMSAVHTVEEMARILGAAEISIKG